MSSIGTDLDNRLKRNIGQASILAIIASCFPFLLVDIPPLVDVPGHIAMAAIESAPSDSSILTHYEWNWHFTLNMGGEGMMKALGAFMSPFAAGWLLCVLSTAMLVGGLIAISRTLNSERPSGLGWALIFCFGFPWIWGFVNFLLAVGIALLAAAASFALEERPWVRNAVLAVAQPAAMMCHAIGGMLLPIIVACVAIGWELDRRSLRTNASNESSLLSGLIDISWSVFWRCWPLLISFGIIVAWYVGSTPSKGTDLSWSWGSKKALVLAPLRDQFEILDSASTMLAYAVLVFGVLRGARWSRRAGLTAAAVAAMFLTFPARINGSEAVDARLFPVAMMLLLGLQDWSSVSRKVATWIMWSGFAIFSVRIAVISDGFIKYQTAYRAELQALDHVTRGTKIHTVHEQRCNESSWRLPRLDTLPMLATATRESWINNGWTIPGLHMLRSKHPAPAINGGINPSVAWDPACKHQGTLSQIMPLLPIADVDYVWFVDTGIPADVSPALRPIWRRDRSILYEVDASRGRGL